ncbi:MAG: PAS domain S-box protein [Candidatus Sumerlaeia bacterium]|nr:PAS domain S-box protein [Candidatus Sumerlaeia bacterium]
MNQTAQRWISGVSAWGLAAAMAVALAMLAATLAVDRWLVSLGEQGIAAQVDAAANRAAAQIEQEFAHREQFATAWIDQWRRHDDESRPPLRVFFSALLDSESLFDEVLVYDRIRPAASQRLSPQPGPLPDALVGLIPELDRLIVSMPWSGDLFHAWLLPRHLPEIEEAYLVADLGDGRYLLARMPLAERMRRLLTSYQNEQIGLMLSHRGFPVKRLGPVERADAVRHADRTVRTGRRGDGPLELRVFTASSPEISLLASVRRLIVAGGVMLALALGGLTLGWARSASLFLFAKRRHRLLHDRSPLYYHSVTADMVMRDANRTVCEALGYAHGELVGRPLAEIVPEGPDLIQALDDESRPRRSSRATVSYRTRTGESREVDLTLLAEEDEFGRRFWLMLGQDVTERLRAEREKHATEQRLGQLTHAAESLDEGMLVLDGEGRISYANPAARRFLDPGAKGLVGRTIDDVIPRMNGEQTWATIREAAEKRQPWTREFSPPSRSAAPMRLAVSFAGESRQEEGAVAFLLLLRDITQERHLRLRLESSQRKYQTIFDQAPTGILTIDRTGTILDANPYYRRRLAPKLDAQADTGGLSILLHPAIVQAGAPALMADLLAGKEIAADPIPVQDAEGAFVMALSLRGVPEIEDGGEVRRAYLFLQDVTGPYLLRKQQEERATALEGEKERALESSRLKSQFLATISHELRTPLNAIIGFTRIVARKAAGAMEPRHVEYLDKIEDSGQKLLRLVNDLLDVSRIEAGRMEVNYESVPLAPFFEGLRGEIEPLVEANANRLEFDVQGDIGMMETDAQRLHQVLVNLLGNAAKFTHHGVVRLAVTAEPMPEATANEWIRFVVSDTGVGIPADQQQEIFQEFYQVDGSTTRRYAGTGLGLAICRRLVELMEGTIGVRSEEGCGAEFDVRLPRRPLRRQASDSVKT